MNTGNTGIIDIILDSSLKNALYRTDIFISSCENGIFSAKIALL